METVSRSHARLKSMVFVALMAAFLCIFSPISIPLPLVPITLQTFGVFLVSALLGWKRGTVAVLIYLLLGLIGLPVFSGWTGGFSSFATPSSGYIIGFLFTALLTGFLIDRFSRQFWMYPVAMAAGLAVCHLFGTIWFLVYMNVWMSTPYSFWEAVLICVLPFLVGDAVKIAAATALSYPLRKQLVRNGVLTERRKQS